MGSETVSFLLGRWANPEGGETVEFKDDGAMVVSRGSDVLASQLYTAQDNGVGAGRLSLRRESGGEVVLGYCVTADILAMSYAGKTSIYCRIPG